MRELTDKNIRRGSFPGVPDLIASIEDYLRGTNANPKPLIWTANANEPAEETNDDERRRDTMSYKEIQIPEDPGERILEVLKFSPRSRIDTGS